MIISQSFRLVLFWLLRLGPSILKVFTGSKPDFKVYFYAMDSFNAAVLQFDHKKAVNANELMLCPPLKALLAALVH